MTSRHLLPLTRRADLARLGMNVHSLAETIELALEGEVVSRLLVGQYYYPIIVRLEPQRQSMTVRPTGMMVLYREQHQLLSRDLQKASALALVLCILLVALGVRWAPAPLPPFPPQARKS